MKYSLQGAKPNATFPLVTKSPKVPKNLNFLYSCFAGLPPPTILILTGKGKEIQSSRAGTFVLGDGLVNGHPHWLKTNDGSQAI